HWNEIQADFTIPDVDERKPGPTQQVMNQVINTVVLPRFAGLRITANNGRSMDRDRQFVLRGFDLQFREVLRLFVEVAITSVVSQLRLEDHSFASSGNVAG